MTDPHEAWAFLSMAVYFQLITEKVVLFGPSFHNMKRCETNDSSYRLGGGKLKKVATGLSCSVDFPSQGAQATHDECEPMADQQYPTPRICWTVFYAQTRRLPISYMASSSYAKEGIFDARGLTEDSTADTGTVTILDTYPGST